MKKYDNLEGDRKIIKLLLLLMIMIIIILLVGYAWARYSTLLGGNTNSQVAKWSFKVSDGKSDNIDNIKFATTRTDGNDAVERETVGPRNIWSV